MQLTNKPLIVRIDQKPVRRAATPQEASEIYRTLRQQGKVKDTQHVLVQNQADGCKIINSF